MPDNYERRSYQRSGDFFCLARVSRDAVLWHDAEVFDLSSGGLKFNAAERYEIGERLCFDLKITGFLTEFEILVHGWIRRRDHTLGHETYGVRFENLSQDNKIRIDECVSNFRPKDILY